MIAFSALGLAAVIGGVEIRADGKCPSESDVRVAFAEAGVPEANPSEGLHVLVEEGVLPPAADVKPVSAVTLLDSQGNLLARRQIEPGSTCRERAVATAIFTATWIAQSAAGLRPQAGSLSPPPLPPSDDQPSDLGVAGIARPSDERWTFLPLRIGVHAMPTVALSGTAPATVGVDFQLSSRLSDGIRVHSGVMATPSRRLALSPGEMSWQRTALALGISVDVAKLIRDNPVSMRVAPMLAFTTVKGHGFVNDRQVKSTVPGVRFGAGWLMRLSGRLHLDLAATCMWWLASEDAVVRGGAMDVEVPHSDLVFSAGLLVDVAR